MLLRVTFGSFLLFTFHAVAKPIDNSNIYYLSVGSAHFAVSQTYKWNLSTIEAASRAAHRVADLLDTHGATYGIVLTSTEQQDGKAHHLAHSANSPLLMVSKSDIFDQLSKVVSTAQEDETGKALIIVYLSSHGFAKGSSQAHYTVPSNIVFTRDPLKLPRRMIWEKLLYAGEIVRALKTSGMPYILMLDTCYENSSTWQEKVYSIERERFQQGPVAWDNLVESERNREKFMSTFPVVFAVEAGGFVFTVPDPRDASSAETIAPLARRMTLLFDKADANDITIYGSDIVDGLTDEALDNITTPGVTYSRKIFDLRHYPLVRSPIDRERIYVFGSASKPTFCCSGEDFMPSDTWYNEIRK